MSGMNEAPANEPAELPPDLKFLKWLVTALTATMIFGLLTIIVLFVTRLPPAGGTVATGPVLPPGITLPKDAEARAVTFGQGWVAVVTDSDMIMIYDSTTGALRQQMKIAPAP